MRKFLLLIILIFGVLTCFAQEKRISFADGSALTVDNSVLNGRKPQSPPVKYSALSIVNKEFTAYLAGIGKAMPPLDNEALKLIRRKNKSLHAQIRQINSAYELTKDDTKYYFAVFDSLNYNKFNNCSPEKPCKVKCRAIIFQLSGKSAKKNILILKSFDYEQ